MYYKHYAHTKNSQKALPLEPYKWKTLRVETLSTLCLVTLTRINLEERNQLKDRIHLIVQIEPLQALTMMMIA